MTYKEIEDILNLLRMCQFDKPVTTAIFRYRKGYECEYESNLELPIDVAVEEYKKYLNWKFKGKFKICQNAEVL